MSSEIVKNKTVDYYNSDLIETDIIEGEHFGLPIHKKNYPSCYRYNVLVMLAKRLIREENNFANRLCLDKQFVKRILTFD